MATNNRWIPGRPSIVYDPLYLQKLQRALITETRVKQTIQKANFSVELERFYPCDATSGNITVTLPQTIAAVDKVYVIKKIDASANTVIITPRGADTIDGGATLTLTTQWDVAIIRSDGISQWYVEHKLIGGGSTTSCFSGTYITVAGTSTIAVPAGVNSGRFRLQGAGAAGGGTTAGATNQAGGGGGAGELVDIIIAVTPSGTVSYTVGAKGSGVSAGTGGNGSATTITGANGVTYSAAGGIGGQNNSSGGAGGGRLGGAGGTKATPGNPGGAGVSEGGFSTGGGGGGGPGSSGTNTPGGTGGANDSFAGGAGGNGAALPAPGSGGGGSSIWGSGAAGVVGNNNSNGNSATATSYGAAGSGASGGASAHAGGNGADGAIWYQWL